MSFAIFRSIVGIAPRRIGERHGDLPSKPSVNDQGGRKRKIVPLQEISRTQLLFEHERHRPRSAFEGRTHSEFWAGAHTVASGLRVPKPLGDFLVLDAVRNSGGTAIAVSDTEMLDAGIELATDEGIFAAPEGGACAAALKKLLASGFLKPEERMVLYNTGAGQKYLEAYSTRFPRTTASEQDKLGGLITPR